MACLLGHGWRLADFSFIIIGIENTVVKIEAPPNRDELITGPQCA
jgi:hypothetical protein